MGFTCDRCGRYIEGSVPWVGAGKKYCDSCAESYKDNEKTEGKKYDEDKVRLHLLPWDSVYAVGEIVEHGAKKYEPENWKKMKERTRYESAMLRHYIAIKDGEVYDRDSGFMHWAHLACNALFLLHFALEEEKEKNKGKGEEYNKREEGNGSE